MPFTLAIPGTGSYTDSLHSFLFPVNALHGEQNLPNLQNISKSGGARESLVMGVQAVPRVIPGPSPGLFLTRAAPQKDGGNVDPL